MCPGNSGVGLDQIFWFFYDLCHALNCDIKRSDEAILRVIIHAELSKQAVVLFSQHFLITTHANTFLRIDAGDFPRLPSQIQTRHRNDRHLDRS